MFTQLKAIIAGVILLVVLIIAGLIYWRGSSNANTKNDLRVAREVIKTERETLKITSQIDMRVNAEGIQTANTAQEANREIEAIRQRQPVSGPAGLQQCSPSDLTAVRGDLAGDASRVLQLAREARAAAVASSAKLQPARAGTR